LLPLSLLDFGELIIIEIVIRIHFDNLSFSWSSHNFDNLDEMIDAVISDEKWSAIENLQNDAPY